MEEGLVAELPADGLVDSFLELLRSWVQAKVGCEQFEGPDHFQKNEFFLEIKHFEAAPVIAVE